jgi:hypothetical protein
VSQLRLRHTSVWCSQGLNLLSHACRLLNFCVSPQSWSTMNPCSDAMPGCHRRQLRGSTQFAFIRARCNTVLASKQQRKALQELHSPLTAQLCRAQNRTRWQQRDTLCGPPVTTSAVVESFSRGSLFNAVSVCRLAVCSRVTTACTLDGSHAQHQGTLRFGPCPATASLLHRPHTYAAGVPRSTSTSHGSHVLAWSVEVVVLADRFLHIPPAKAIATHTHTADGQHTVSGYCGAAQHAR